MRGVRDGQQIEKTIFSSAYWGRVTKRQNFMLFNFWERRGNFVVNQSISRNDFYGKAFETKCFPVSWLEFRKLFFTENSRHWVAAYKIRQSIIARISLIEINDVPNSTETITGQWMSTRYSFLILLGSYFIDGSDRNYMAV